MPDTAIHAASWLITPNAPPLAGGAILIRDGRIVARGTRDELRRAHTATLHEYPDCAILPGFVNAHTHLELTHFPAWRERNGMGYAPRTFVDWVIQLVKICRGLQPDDFRLSLREGLRKCVEAGTTAIGDILTRYDLAAGYGAIPLAGRIYCELLGHEEPRFDERLRQALEALQGHFDTPLSTGLSPHAPYTLATANLEKVREAARSGGLRLAIHLAESRAEADLIFDTTGPLAETFYPFVGWQEYLRAPQRCTPTEFLDRLGLLTPATMAVHCVQVTPADARILRERGVAICLCPRSNDRLDVGQAPVALYQGLGCTLALGTDSLASNDSLSLWDEMRYALDAFPGCLAPRDVLRMATSGGAAALGLAECVGDLEPGQRADFQVVRNIGGIGNGDDLLERVIGQGRVAEVFLGGVGAPEVAAP